MDTLQQPIASPLSTEANISDEKRQQLLYAADRLKAQVEDTKMRMNASKNLMEVKRKKELRKVFERMQFNGVNLSDRQSVSNYIEKLRQNNPETAANFEKAMDYLMTGEQNNNMNNINQNETLPQNTQGLDR